MNLRFGTLFTFALLTGLAFEARSSSTFMQEYMGKGDAQTCARILEMNPFGTLTGDENLPLLKHRIFRFAADELVKRISLKQPQVADSLRTKIIEATNALPVESNYERKTQSFRANFLPGNVDMIDIEFRARELDNVIAKMLKRGEGGLQVDGSGNQQEVFEMRLRMKEPSLWHEVAFYLSTYTNVHKERMALFQAADYFHRNARGAGRAGFYLVDLDLFSLVKAISQRHDVDVRQLWNSKAIPSLDVFAALFQIYQLDPATLNLWSNGVSSLRIEFLKSDSSRRSVHISRPVQQLFLNFSTSSSVASTKSLEAEVLAALTVKPSGQIQERNLKMVLDIEEQTGVRVLHRMNHGWEVETLEGDAQAYLALRYLMRSSNLDFLRQLVKEKGVRFLRIDSVPYNKDCVITGDTYVMGFNTDGAIGLKPIESCKLTN